MKFSEVLETVDLIIAANDVPLIIGESGIGKTALARTIAKENSYYLVNIDANLLKEGEIGGLPTISNGKTIYATHYKLAEIDEALKNNYEVLLFIDELNRCDHAVQQELMNLILNREINGFKLGEHVHIIAAMNPSSKYENYRDSNYQVVDMDEAQEDRFVWIEMESDIKEWIKWGMEKGRIHEDIIEFLSAFPHYLHTPDSRETLKATPRSWERISKAYKVYKKVSESKKEYSFKTFINVVRGNVGDSITADLTIFLTNLKKPLIDAEKLFSYDAIPIELQEDIKNESHSRLYILAKNSLNYLESNLDKDNYIKIFSNLLSFYPKDLRLGIMKEIKRDYSKELYEKLLQCDEFLNAFFEIYVRV
ncbi:MAG: AAA family ATPase [Clostridium sp.]|uniref:AAA family ATPase n=1 Tax=Clostridium sp. DSM 8431 TaxID=1761781 RepID=UPI0008F3FC4E|nr:AAA family ATPase [Clostridium sp. DSM 8431]MCR4944634.1 AAA family ATPase [Clostridium sp.]SFU81863.1 ATPase family associated with various cellular activities (AAA) [Clostridium sp. DSM 8431]